MGPILGGDIRVLNKPCMRLPEMRRIEMAYAAHAQEVLCLQAIA